MSKGGVLMAKFWDKVMKMLVHANPQDFLSLISQETGYVSDITNEQITRSIEADFLCNAVRSNQEIVVHLEFQRSNDTNMGKRMWNTMPLPHILQNYLFARLQSTYGRIILSSSHHTGWS
jgi:hypothetical protein